MALALGLLAACSGEQQPEDAGPIDLGTANIRDVPVAPRDGGDDGSEVGDTDSDSTTETGDSDIVEDGSGGDTPGDAPRDTGGGGSDTGRDRATDSGYDPDPGEPPVICEPNAGRCVFDVAILCNEYGTEETNTECHDPQICFGGECLTPFCEPDTVTCVDNVLVRCDSLGLSIFAVHCGEGTCVENECVPRVCTPGVGDCDKDTGIAELCAFDGLSFETTECESSDDCMAGFCLSAACAGDHPFCANDTLVTCDFDVPDAITCETRGSYCEDLGSFSDCVIRTCAPDVVSCSTDGGTIRYCDGTGRDRYEYDCAESHECFEGTCRWSRCTQYWPDADEDGHGDVYAEPVCTIAPPGTAPPWVTNNGDCDDNNDGIHDSCEG